MTEPAADLDVVLGSRREFTSREVCDTVGIPMYRARRYWRAMGFANVPESGAEFTSADIDALSSLVGLVRDRVFDEAQTLEMARALGRATARLSISHVEEMIKALDARGARGAERNAAALRVGERVLPEMDKLLLYCWRRHLAVALQRLPPDVSFADPAVATVGFADLVGFTRLSRRLSAHDLATLVEQFESRVADLVTSYGGRIIKSLGDELLFVAEDPAIAADIALELADRIQRWTDFPGVRIGVELGPVINYAGDVFGDTVNLASRLTAMTEPNRVLVGPALAAVLTPSVNYQLVVTPPIKVRGYGVVAPSALLRSGTTHDS